MDYSKKYIREKRKVSKVLQNILQIGESISESRMNRHLFSESELKKISEIVNRGESYLQKLESDIFEIAIVGLEKAGKSTFANALIDNAVLPSAPERCTFTSTKLVYGEDRAEVILYSEAEFNSIFREMLQDLGYPNGERENFRTMSIEKFDKFFEELKSENPNLYNLHTGKSDEEIREILKYRDSLQLSGERVIFSNEQLSSDEFQSYIRGEKRGVETDTSKPRSVKSVSIESSKLSQMESATIFDVPGFDSPTKIHERQTLERLKNADAIILVTNAGDRPNITASQLDTIRKDSDADGVRLSEKLFIFGNKMDTAHSIDIVENNRSYLINDVVNRYRIAEERRVFTGSALKYLWELGIIDTERYHDRVGVASGVHEIRRELINYYENERFEILKRKVEFAQSELIKIVEKLLQREQSIKLSHNEDSHKNIILRKAFKEIENRLRENLNLLKMELKREILEGLYFTNRFKDDTNRLDYFQPISGDLFDKIESEVSNSLTTETPVERINHRIRETIHQQYLRDFTVLIKSMTDEKAREIDKKILDRFIRGLVGEDGSISSELEEESERFISSLTEDIAHNEGRFFYLIDRFSRDLFDILLLYPVKSEDRTKKFETTGVEFKFLDNYYNGGDGSLVNLILTQKESKSSINIPEILKNAVRSSSKNSVIKEINTDIENLKMILKKGIIRAINLEVAFLNSVDKKIKILLDSVYKFESEESQHFDEFIAHSIVKIKHREFSEIEKKIRDGEESLKLFNSLKEELPKLRESI
jgi:signal recognition particle receptor subunit beta